MTEKKNLLLVIALICLSYVTFLGKGYESLLRGIDSNIHAEVSMDMTSEGFIPKVPALVTRHAVAGTAQLDPGISRVPFNDHPFFLFWVNGWVMRALGPSAWSARVLTATFSVGCVLMTLALGTLLSTRLFGVLAALFLIFTRDFVLTSATNSLDTAMVFFILLTFYFWLRKNWIGLAVAAGIGLWIKTPVVLLVFPTALIVSLITRGARKEIPTILKAGAAAITIGSTIWIVYGNLAGWEWVRDYWIRQVWGTAIGGRSQGQSEGWSLFLYTLKTGFIPGLPFLVYALYKVWQKRAWVQKVFLVPATAAIILAIAISSMRFQLGHYYTPIFPFLALMSSYSVYDLLHRYEDRFYRTLKGFALLLITFLVCTPTTLGPEAFVALRRFIPLIQSYGTCKDPINLVPGGEPVGSSHDYSLALSFYTGRPIRILTCEEAAKQKDGWVILSQDNLHRCGFSGYQSRFKVGSQYMLTNLIPDPKTFDFTALERSPKAVRDCQPPDLPQDVFHRY